VVQGIRRNQDLGMDRQEPFSFETPKPVRPLRYTPGMKCDAALEALRPEREMKHQPLQGGDQWRRKLIQVPTTFDGSFADADMQQFRPNPNPNPLDDPWYSSRLPDHPQAPMQMMGPDLGPYSTAYPQDELSRIKMRNRRFQQSCAMDGMQGGYCPAPGLAPAWRGPVLTPPAAPAITEDMMMGYAPQGYPPQDDLAMLDQELNMTRRATRPFVPNQDPGYFELQRQVNMLETMPTVPVRAPRVDEMLGTDQLPAPKKVVKADAAPPEPAGRHQVRIADQIAIRSYVLGKNIDKIAE